MCKDSGQEGTVIAAWVPVPPPLLTSCAASVELLPSLCLFVKGGMAHCLPLREPSGQPRLTSQALRTGPGTWQTFKTQSGIQGKGDAVICGTEAPSGVPLGLCGPTSAGLGSRSPAPRRGHSFALWVGSPSVFPQICHGVMAWSEGTAAKL